MVKMAGGVRIKFQEGELDIAGRPGSTKLPRGGTLQKSGAISARNTLVAKTENVLGERKDHRDREKAPYVLSRGNTIRGPGGRSPPL